MLVRSDELGDELRQTRTLLFGSIHREERLGHLAARCCCLRNLRAGARIATGQRELVKAERTGEDTELQRT